jgi:hypothetical protein
MGSQKDKNQKRGIIRLGLIERAKCFTLQPKVGVAFQQEVFALQCEVDDNGRARMVHQNAH